MSLNPINEKLDQLSNDPRREDTSKRHEEWISDVRELFKELKYINDDTSSQNPVNVENKETNYKPTNPADIDIVPGDKKFHSGILILDGSGSMQSHARNMIHNIEMFANRYGNDAPVRVFGSEENEDSRNLLVGSTASKWLEALRRNSYSLISGGTSAISIKNAIQQAISACPVNNTITIYFYLDGLFNDMSMFGEQHTSSRLFGDIIKQLQSNGTFKNVVSINVIFPSSMYHIACDYVPYNPANDRPTFSQACRTCINFDSMSRQITGILYENENYIDFKALFSDDIRETGNVSQLMDQQSGTKTEPGYMILMKLDDFDLHMKHDSTVDGIIDWLLIKNDIEMLKSIQKKLNELMKIKSELFANKNSMYELWHRIFQQMKEFKKYNMSPEWIDIIKSYWDGYANATSSNSQLKQLKLNSAITASDDDIQISKVLEIISNKILAFQAYQHGEIISNQELINDIVECSTKAPMNIMEKVLKRIFANPKVITVPRNSTHGLYLPNQDLCEKIGLSYIDAIELAFRNIFRIVGIPITLKSHNSIFNVVVVLLTNTDIDVPHILQMWVRLMVRNENFIYRGIANTDGTLRDIVYEANTAMTLYKLIHHINSMKDIKRNKTDVIHEEMNAYLNAINDGYSEDAAREASMIARNTAEIIYNLPNARIASKKAAETYAKAYDTYYHYATAIASGSALSLVNVKADAIAAAKAACRASSNNYDLFKQVLEVCAVFMAKNAIRKINSYNGSVKVTMHDPDTKLSFKQTPDTVVMGLVKLKEDKKQYVDPSALWPSAVFTIKRDDDKFYKKFCVWNNIEYETHPITLDRVFCTYLDQPYAEEIFLEGIEFYRKQRMTQQYKNLNRADRIKFEKIYYINVGQYEKKSEGEEPQFGRDSAHIPTKHLIPYAIVNQEDFPKIAKEIFLLLQQYQIDDFYEKRENKTAKHIGELPEEARTLREMRDNEISNIMKKYSSDVVRYIDKIIHVPKHIQLAIVKQMYPSLENFDTVYKKYQIEHAIQYLNISEQPITESLIKWIIDDLGVIKIDIETLIREIRTLYNDCMIIEIPPPKKHGTCAICFEEEIDYGDREHYICGPTVCKVCNDQLIDNVRTMVREGIVNQEQCIKDGGLLISNAYCPFCRSHPIITKDHDDLKRVLEFIDQGVYDQHDLIAICKRDTCQRLFVAGYKSCLGVEGAIQTECEHCRPPSEPVFLKCKNNECKFIIQHDGGCYIMRCCRNGGYHCPYENGLYCECQDPKYPEYGCGMLFTITREEARIGNIGLDDEEDDELNEDEY